MTLFHSCHDAVSPDGYLCSSLQLISPGVYEGEIEIQNIPSYFLGFQLPLHCVHLNLKSSLAQLGIDATLLHCELSKNQKRAHIHAQFTSHGPIAESMLTLLKPGDRVAKLFAADERRLVRSPDYLESMLKNTDKAGHPLLCFGKKLEHLISFDVVDDRLVVSLPTLPGIVRYDSDIYGLLPLIQKSLSNPKLSIRHFLSLYQQIAEGQHIPCEGNILLIKTEPLHIRTVFARVVNQLLPQGLFHTSANILEPTTQESGDIFEFFGNPSTSIERIPLEFFTIEPYKEHSYFCNRDLLQTTLQSESEIKKIFGTAPQGPVKAATYLSKGSEIPSLYADSWLTGSAAAYQCSENLAVKDEYIHAQPCYPFLEAMEMGLINSEGALLSRFFPSSSLKGMLISYHVRHYLKQIYFQVPSYTYGDYFSHNDRGLLLDLHQAGIDVFWADEESGRVLQYTKRRDKNSGMFVVKDRVEEFRSAFFVAIYGSRLLENNFSAQLHTLLAGLQRAAHTLGIPGFSKPSPLAVITGGGTGVMATGNRVAKELGILSCGTVLDLEASPAQIDQPANEFLDAKMTYRLPQLIERQEHFYADLAILVVGGVGTDFELYLELVYLKTGAKPPTPIFLIGPVEYWKEKVAHAYEINLKAGTIRGSEWISNCLFCITSPEAGVAVFEQFLAGELPIGYDYPPAPDGLVIV